MLLPVGLPLLKLGAAGRDAPQRFAGEELGLEGVLLASQQEAALAGE